ncbi:predicted protein [Lichtheimia corymbifera JMRC:FSU:9682]|uniref:Uncharacterized protein n=1 Tax=Lichtheimia corymbifera JMRC:FSU:9682 TaxID=1263082 RepID=A0A068RJ60_9FUNG|nr:predicted protein [Lichtheimia corymbifera JMRC:FSU:9682]
MSYFRETSPGQWSFNDAVQYYSKKDPSLSHRTIVRQIKEDLERLAASKDLPNGKAAAAYLKSWKRIKKLPLAKGKEKELVAGSSSGGGISIGELNVGGVGNHISLKSSSTTSIPSSSRVPVVDDTDGDEEGSIQAVSTPNNDYDEEAFTPVSGALDDVDDEEEQGEPRSSLTDDYHETRKCEYDFIIHGEDENGEDGEQWIVEGFDVLRSLKNYRRKSFDIDPKSMSDTRILAINNIYMFSIDEKQSVIAHMDVYDEGDSSQRGQRIKKQIHADLEVGEGSTPINTTIYGWCAEVSQNAQADYFQIQLITSNILASAVSSQEEVQMIAANALHRLAINFSTSQHIDTSLEDTFAHGVIGIILESVFQAEPLLSYKWANGQLGAKRKREAATFKPDFIVFVTQSSKQFNVGAAEIKPPGKANSTNNGESDRVKLGHEMKAMLDDLISYGVESPVVGGISLEGCSMSTYKMSLDHPQVYKLIQLSTIAIFNNTQELVLLPPILKNLIQVKNIVLKTAIKAKKRSCERSNGIPACHRPPLSYMSSCSYKLKRRAKSNKDKD